MFNFIQTPVGQITIDYFFGWNSFFVESEDAEGSTNRGDYVQI